MKIKCNFKEQRRSGRVLGLEPRGSEFESSPRHERAL